MLEVYSQRIAGYIEIEKHLIPRGLIQRKQHLK